ncbi:MAG: ABC transporter ATP-binding protein [Phycisphaeraceae bacterium]
MRVVDERNNSTSAPSRSDDKPDAPPHRPIVRLVDVYKSFGPLKVLAGVSLDILPGQTTVIMGPSGAGKSVLLKHIAGLLKPDRGQVWFHDQRIDNLRQRELIDVRKRMGFLFQMGALFDSMNVLDNICFPLLEHTRMKLEERRQRCDAVLRMVGLAGIEKKMPGDLSGGQKKRVALARAVVLEPQVVLFDEPTTGLDPIRADVINELIIAMGQQLGITNIVVTHDIASANKIAHRMVMLYDAKIIADGDSQAFAQSDNDLVQRFIKGQAEQSDLDHIREGFAKTAPVLVPDSGGNAKP